MSSLSLLLAAASAAAQTAETAPASDLPTVRVKAAKESLTYHAPTARSATKVEAPQRDIPQTVDVVPAPVLRDQAVLSVQDALRNVPGVGLSHGDGQRDQVTIRGFSAIGDQFVDGMRDDALYFRDLSNVERIEVLKGPASVLYGRGSSGGLVNRVSKKPGVDVGELTVQFGSWQQRRAQLDYGQANPDEVVSFRVTGAIERANSYRDPQFLDRTAFAPSLLLRLAPTTRLLVQADYLEDARITDFGIPAYQGRPVNVRPGAYYGAANARDVDVSRSRVTSAGFELSHGFSDTLSLRNAFRFYDYVLDRKNTLVGSVNEGAGTASLNRSNVTRAEHGFFNQTELTQKLRTGSVDHQLLYGIEIARQHKDQVFRSQNNVATVDLFNPVLPVLPLLVTAAPATNNVGELDTTGVYVQDLVTFTPQWKALAGVRFDRFEQATEERRAGQANLARTDNAVSPRVGVVWQPSDVQSYYVSLSKSFQPSGESFPVAANNAQIEPEETTNREVGAKFDLFGGRASLNVAVFRLERTNIKTTDPATNTLVPMGTQRTDGLEASFNGDLGGGWQLVTGYAYLDAKMTKSIAVDAGQPVQGKHATLTSRQQANVWATHTLSSGWGGGAGVAYVGDRFANAGNTVVLPAYTKFDAAVWWRGKDVDVQLNVFNLTDREYIVAGHGSSPQLNLPGAPRSAQLTARLRF
ncbi:TonB-dependent receptor [Rhizobacter sp. Root1221]|uniref:TonB-dependent receptor n=1 Tax=Rhizobacter sp. Root1221 TaxID=1736433 RepID=UPI00351463DF